MSKNDLRLNFDDEHDDGFINGIPLKNVWLLMLYAFEFKYIKNDKFDVEDNPEDIPDLIAHILCSQVELRIKRNLSLGYETRDDVIDRVRGRIDILRTETLQLLKRGKIACIFHDFTVDTSRNRFVRDALEAISKIIVNDDDNLSRKCRILANRLRSMGVNGESGNKIDYFNERFGVHDREDIPMIQAAHLALNLALPTESSGIKILPTPLRNENEIARLFENAIRGFYRMNASSYGWFVRNHRRLKWTNLSLGYGTKTLFPIMETDIILQNHDNSHQIVIDTKFKPMLTKNKQGKEKFRSADIYQIYAYLRSQEANDGVLVADATGILLYPSVGEKIEETKVVKIQNHEIRFAAVNLGMGQKTIREQLLSFLD